MERIWRDAPTAALRVWQRGSAAAAPERRVEANGAALEWAQRHGVEPLAWSALADASEAQGARFVAAVAASHAALAVDTTKIDLDDGWLLWLALRDDEASRARGSVADRIAIERRTAEFLDRALTLAEVSAWRTDLTTRLVHFNSVGIGFADIEARAEGVPLDELRGLVHPDDLPIVMRAADEASATQRVIDVVARYRNRSGGWSTLLTRRVAERDGDGRAVALVGISIDLGAQVAERARAESLQQQKRRAEQQRRDHAAFLSRMSRELRTPMNTVLGFARLLSENVQEALTPRQREHIERILGAATELQSIADGLFEIAAPPEPASPEPAHSDPAPAGADRAAPRKLLTIVCVEDNPVNMMLVRELLALRPEVALHCAVDGLSGVELALRVRPQAMLLDLQLPDIGGQEVMLRVRDELGDGSCCFVALSANALPDHIRQMLELGFDQYWTKPIDFTRFLGGIDAMIEQRAKAT